VTPTPPPTPVSFRIRVDDTLYGTPTSAPGWWTDYQPYVVTPVRPLVRDLRNGWDTSADAARYFAGRVQVELAKLLVARTDLAVDVRYSGRLKAAVDAPEVARFKGNTSGAALAWMLKVSDNDVAEMFFRNNAIAAKATPTWAGARAAAQAHLASLGIDVRGWRLADGSGVSRVDRLTTRGLVQLLRLAQSPKHPELAPLRAMLPVAGRTGTLAASNGRYTTRPTICARGKVFAKTGTLHDVVGLAGYALGSDGRLRAFAVMVNSRSTKYSKLTVRRAVDRVPATLTGCY
jgi:D-alanyl-D-alanine carboxypeptidase/D-alanyl-D-alanine-endopeptidase (penicillin-binding protein 4)